MSPRYDLRAMDAPIIGAPMAGGPTTPALAAAATNAGGLGFLAAGYRTADTFVEQLTQARSATTGPLGVNLFVPQPSAADASTIDSYRRRLQPLADRFGVELGQPHPDDDDWTAKLEVLTDMRPEVASFTFGAPAPDVLARLADSGITTMVTVTTVEEARLAVDAGAAALVLQGPEAGGHRGTFSPTAAPGTVALEHLLPRVLSEVNVPVVAAGGLSTAADIAAIISMGAVAAQVGTALLLADEAGTHLTHRQVLQNNIFQSTAVTAAFSGRYARGLRNNFVEHFDQHAPLGYPDVNQITGPLRSASSAAGNPHYTNLWAGTGFRHARPASAADILAQLTAELPAPRSLRR